MGLSRRPINAPSLPPVAAASQPAPRPYTPAQLLSFREADNAFYAIDRYSEGKITPGLLLCAMAERDLNAEKLLAPTFLRMDLSGTDAITLDEWRQGYPRFVKGAGLRFLKTSDPTTGEPKQYTPQEMRAFDARAEELLTPSVKKLENTFALFDRDGCGLVRVPHLTAYARVLGGKKDESAHGTGLAAPDPALVVKFLDRQGKEGISFNEFRAILARHEAAFADDGSGKGKKKKDKGGKKKGKKK